jgi:hypothetical protein
VAEALDCSPSVIVTSDPNGISQLLGDHPVVIVQPV